MRKSVAGVLPSGSIVTTVSGALTPAPSSDPRFFSFTMGRAEALEAPLEGPDERRQGVDMTTRRSEER